MFDKYGNFDSVEEMNWAAEKLANQGKDDEVKDLARENGFEDYVAEMYLSGDLPSLCPDPADAATAKLAIEKKEMKITGVLNDWINYIEAQCVDDEKVARAVRSKKKSLVGCLAELMLYSLLNQHPVETSVLEIVERKVKDQKIDLKKTAGIEPAWLKYTRIGIMDMGTARKLIRDYYLEAK